MRFLATFKKTKECSFERWLKLVDDLKPHLEKNGLKLIVAMQNEDGTRIYDSAIFDSDSIEHKVTWRNHVNLNHLKGKNIRLKFYLKSADLYSFTIKTD